MPWDNQGGGGQGPWGQNSGGGGGNRNNPPTPPDLDELFKKGREQFKGIFGGKGGGKAPILLILLVILGFWLSTGVYTVDSGEQGVVLRFGAFHAKTGAGLRYHLPTPIERVIIVPIEQDNTVNIGVRSSGGRDIKVLEESLMLTVNRNIADLQFGVNWKIKDAAHFLFNVRDPSQTVKSVAESVMREVVSHNKFDDVTVGDKDRITTDAKIIMQRILDEYKTGINIKKLNMLDVQPPIEVIDAFIDVEDAEQDRRKAIAQALAYRNDIIPRARGESEQLMQEAEGYKAQIVAAAEGDASRFLAVYNEYKVAKDITRERIYLETMEEVLKGTDKILLDQSNGGSGIVPYLPLNELRKR